MAAVNELVASGAHAGSVEILVALRFSADKARTVKNCRPPAGKGRLSGAFVTVSVEVRSAAPALAQPRSVVQPEPETTKTRAVTDRERHDWLIIEDTATTRRRSGCLLFLTGRRALERLTSSTSFRVMIRRLAPEVLLLV
jgi:hypothetical protein